MPVSTGVLVLIKSVDATHADATKDLMCYKRGDVVEVFAPGTPYVTPPAAPFYLVDITDAALEQARLYMDPWRREIAYAVVSSNLPQDRHRLRVFVKAEHVSTSGLGGLTREMVESYLAKWGATVVIVAANSVTFDIVVLNAITSEGFWGVPTNAVTFTELSYVQAGGVHTVRATYSGVAMADEDIARLVTELGGTVTAQVPETSITFTITRAAVFAVFQEDVKQRVDGVRARRQWYFLPGAVDAVENAGGFMAVTRAQALTYLRNRLAE